MMAALFRMIYAELDETASLFSQVCGWRKFMGNADRSKMMAFHPSEKVLCKTVYCEAGANIRESESLVYGLNERLAFGR